MIRCARCRVVKEDKEFYKNRSSRNGHDAYCKHCYKVWKAEHYVPSKPRAAYFAQRRNQPHGRYLYTKTQAKVRHKEWNLTEAEYTAAISKPCFYCDGPLPVGSSGIDRLDNSKGYISGNIVPCCYTCNTMKNATLTWQETLVAVKAVQKYRSENAEKTST